MQLKTENSGGDGCEGGCVKGDGGGGNGGERVLGPFKRSGLQQGIFQKKISDTMPDTSM